MKDDHMGPWWDRPKEEPVKEVPSTVVVLTGDARDTVIALRKKYPRLTDKGIVVEVLRGVDMSEIQ